jgi:hypothetical protein
VKTVQKNAFTLVQNGARAYLRPGRTRFGTAQNEETLGLFAMANVMIETEPICEGMHYGSLPTVVA